MIETQPPSIDPAIDAPGPEDRTGGREDARHQRADEGSVQAEIELAHREGRHVDEHDVEVAAARRAAAPHGCPDGAPAPRPT